MGADAYTVLKHNAQALNDGETESQPPLPFTRGIVKLMILLEDRLKLPFGNTDPRIPDLDAEILSTTAAAKQHLAVRGIFQRVRKQVADHLLQQARVAVYHDTALNHAQFKSVGLRVIGEFILQPVQQITDRKADDLRTDNARIDLVHIEQRVQHARHGNQRLVEPRHQLFSSVTLDNRRQKPLKESQRLKRLAEVMAGRSQKPRLRDACRLRLLLGHLQR